jgi:hypothetical protein
MLGCDVVVVQQAPATEAMARRSLPCAPTASWWCSTWPTRRRAGLLALAPATGCSPPPRDRRAVAASTGIRPWWSPTPPASWSCSSPSWHERQRRTLARPANRVGYVSGRVRPGRRRPARSDAGRPARTSRPRRRGRGRSVPARRGPHPVRYEGALPRPTGLADGAEPDAGIRHQRLADVTGASGPTTVFGRGSVRRWSRWPPLRRRRVRRPT